MLVSRWVDSLNISYVQCFGWLPELDFGRSRFLSPEYWICFRFFLLPANTIFHGQDFRGCSYSVMFRPPSLLASRIAPTAARFPRRAAEAFTSEQNVRRNLRTHRIC